MAICPRCNAKLTESARFCPLCGASAPSSALRSPNEQIDEAELLEEKSRRWTGAVSGVLCRFCKGPLDLEGEFCEVCGAPLEEAAPPGMVKPKPKPAAAPPTPPVQPPPGETTLRAQIETPPAPSPSATVIFGVAPEVSGSPIQPRESPAGAPPGTVIVAPSPATRQSGAESIPPPPPDRTQRLQLETTPAPSLPTQRFTPPAFAAQPQAREEAAKAPDSALRATPEVPTASARPAQVTQCLQLGEIAPTPPPSMPTPAPPGSSVPPEPPPLSGARPADSLPASGAVAEPTPVVPVHPPPTEVTQRLRVDALFGPPAPSAKPPATPPPQPEKSLVSPPQPSAPDRTQRLRLDALSAAPSSAVPESGLQAERVEVSSQLLESPPSAEPAPAWEAPTAPVTGPQVVPPAPSPPPVVPAGVLPKPSAAPPSATLIFNFNVRPEASASALPSVASPRTTEAVIPPAERPAYAPPASGSQPRPVEGLTQPGGYSPAAEQAVSAVETPPASATQYFHPEKPPTAPPLQATERNRAQAPPPPPGPMQPISAPPSGAEPSSFGAMVPPRESPPPAGPIAPTPPPPRSSVGAPVRPRTAPATATRPAPAPPVAVPSPRKKPIPVAMLALGFVLGLVAVGVVVLLLRSPRESASPEPQATPPAAQVATPPQEIAPPPSEAAPVTSPPEVPAGPTRPRKARTEKQAAPTAPAQPAVSPQAAQMAILQGFAREAYAKGNYVEPLDKGTIAYAKRVLALDPANEYGKTLLEGGVNGGKYQAQQAVIRKDFATAHRLADEMAQLLPRRSDIVALKEDIAVAEKAEEAARRAREAPTPVVSFQVYHLHSRKAPNEGGSYCMGTLGVVGGRLKYSSESTSDGETHNFDVACVDVDEIKANARVASRQGGFHVRTRSANYNFATKAPTSIVPALATACQAF